MIQPKLVAIRVTVRVADPHHIMLGMEVNHQDRKGDISDIQNRAMRTRLREKQKYIDANNCRPNSRNAIHNRILSKS